MKCLFDNRGCPGCGKLEPMHCVCDHYVVSTLDPISDDPDDGYDWTPRHARITKWGLKNALRDVRREYENVSILVEKLE